MRKGGGGGGRERVSRDLGAWMRISYVALILFFSWAERARLRCGENFKKKSC